MLEEKKGKFFGKLEELIILEKILKFNISGLAIENPDDVKGVIEKAKKYITFNQ